MARNSRAEALPAVEHLGVSFAVDPATVKTTIEVIGYIITAIDLFGGSDEDEVLENIGEHLERIYDKLDDIDRRIQRVEKAIAELGVLIRQEQIKSARIALSSVKETIALQYDTWVDIRDEARGSLLLKLADLQQAMLTAMSPDRGGYGHALLVADSQIFAAELMILARANQRTIEKSFRVLDSFLQKAVDPRVEGSWASESAQSSARVKQIESQIRGGNLLHVVPVTHQWRMDGGGHCNWDSKWYEWAQVQGSLDSQFSIAHLGWSKSNEKRNHRCRGDGRDGPRGGRYDLVKDLSELGLSDDAHSQGPFGGAYVAEIPEGAVSSVAASRFPPGPHNTDNGWGVVRSKHQQAEALRVERSKLISRGDTFDRSVIPELKRLRSQMQGLEGRVVALST